MNRRLIDRNIGIATPLAAIALFMTGCANELTREQKAQLFAGESAYSRKEYPRAVDELSKFLASVKDRPEVGRAQYVRGLAEARQERRGDAQRDFRAAAAGKDADAAWRAKFMLGVIAFEDEQWQEAAAQFEAVRREATGKRVEGVGDAPSLDAGMYRLGISYERLGRWEDSRRMLTSLTREHPQSRYAEEARRRLALGAHAYSVQCGAFANSTNAEKLQRDLRARGLNAVVRNERRDSGVYSVVLVGEYSTFAEAKRQLATIRPNVPDARLWPYP